jgi:hypothetical protein
MRSNGHLHAKRLIQNQLPFRSHPFRALSALFNLKSSSMVVILSFYWMYGQGLVE